MKLFLITYDLKQPGRNYTELYDLIKSIAGDEMWQHPLESSWVVKLQDSATVAEITTRIRGVMDSRDSLFVIDITGRQYQGWLPRSFWDWMNK